MLAGSLAGDSANFLGAHNVLFEAALAVKRCAAATEMSKFSAYGIGLVISF